MIITDYYKFSHVKSNSKTRYDCLYGTKTYEPLESLKNGKNELFIYYTDVPNAYKDKVRQKADKCLTKTKNISSLFMPDITKPYAFGDINSTSDGLLVIFNSDQSAFELFIARGQKHNKQNLFYLLADGELDAEIEYFRHDARLFNN